MEGLVTRRLLVMNFLDGLQITRLGDKTKSLSKQKQKMAVERIIHRVAEAYGRQLLYGGLFQADGHPGNILVMKGAPPRAAYTNCHLVLHVFCPTSSVGSPATEYAFIRVTLETMSAALLHLSLDCLPNLHHMQNMLKGFPLQLADGHCSAVQKYEMCKDCCWRSYGMLMWQAQRLA